MRVLIGTIFISAVFISVNGIGAIFNKLTFIGTSSLSGASCLLAAALQWRVAYA